MRTTKDTRVYLRANILRDSGHSRPAALGRDLPDTDVSWNLDRELALSANTGLSAIESGVRKAGSVRRTFRGDFPQHAGEVPQPS
jgi:hypothetical protein